MKMAWVTTWDKPSRISTYSQELWPAVKDCVEKKGGEAHLVSLDRYEGRRAMLRRLLEIKPDLIHFQHEYGIYGGKNPPWYFFPSLVTDLAFKLPTVHMVATAHTVLAPDYRLPLRGRALEMPLRLFANTFLINLLSWNWGQRTWGRMDGVLVHRRDEVDWVKATGADFVEFQPHHVLNPEEPNRRSSPGPKDNKIYDDPSLVDFDSVLSSTITVVGFFARERGQDLAIEALSHMETGNRLVLLGGARRATDQPYLEECLDLARQKGVRSKVAVTGFVNKSMMKRYLSEAAVLLVPFRKIYGPGAITELLRYGLPLVCSDLEEVKELEALQRGAIRMFKTGDAADCAQQLTALLRSPEKCRSLVENAQVLASKLSPERMAEKHFEFYHQALERSPRAKQIRQQMQSDSELPSQNP